MAGEVVKSDGQRPDETPEDFEARREKDLERIEKAEESLLAARRRHKERMNRWA